MLDYEPIVCLFSCLKSYCIYISFIKNMRRPTSRPWRASMLLCAVMFESSGSVFSYTQTCLQWHRATLYSSCSLRFAYLELGTLADTLFGPCFSSPLNSEKFSFKLYHLKKNSITLLSSKYSGRRREVKSNFVMYHRFFFCEV